MKKYLMTTVACVMLASPSFATIDFGEISNNISGQAEKAVEQIQLKISEEFTNLSTKISNLSDMATNLPETATDLAESAPEMAVDYAKDKASDFVEGLPDKLTSAILSYFGIGTINSVPDPKESIAVVAGPLAKEFETEEPLAGEVKTWVDIQMLQDDSTPDTLAATAENSRDQLFVSAAKSYAIGVDAQIRAIEGIEEAQTALHEAKSMNDIVGMNKKMAHMTLEMSQKIGAIGGLYSQLTELNSTSMLIGEDSGG